MAKKKAVSKRGLEVGIDYPRRGEIVKPGHYCLRITAAGASSAQVRFDGGPWSDCRDSVGHFWFDWAPSPGRARIVARARAGQGRWKSSEERETVVTAEGPERDGSIFA